MQKKFFNLFILCCCFLTASSALIPPSSGASNSATATITGTVPLVTYNLSVSGISETRATVFWNTNGAANSTVEYGTTNGYGLILSEDILTKDHSLTLTSLSPGTTYHYRVLSGDLYNRQAVSPDATFTTVAIPTPTPTSRHGGGGGGSGGGGISNVFTGLFGGPAQPGGLEQPEKGSLEEPQKGSPDQPEQGSLEPGQGNGLTENAPSGFAGLHPLILALMLVFGIGFVTLYYAWWRQKPRP